MSLLLAILAAGALVACDSDSDATPTATSTATSTPTATQTATPDDKARLTTDPEIDAIITAVSEQDVATLAGLVEYQDVACTTELGAGGPPKCLDGMAEGTVLRVFPASSCEGYWTSSPVVELGYLTREQRGLYAAIELRDGGGHSLVFHREVNGQRWGAAVIVQDGRITSIATGCGMPPEGFNGAGGQIVAGPWADPVAPVEASIPETTGIDGVDDLIVAVEKYDLNALLTSALAAMQQLPLVACVEESEGIGSLLCDEAKGEVDGTEVSVFPLAYCEGALERDPALPLAGFLNLVPHLVAVVEAPETPSQSDLYPHGAYWIVYEFAAPAAPPAARLHVTESGELTAVWFGCGAEVDEIVSFEGEPLPVILDVRD